VVRLDFGSTVEVPVQRRTALLKLLMGCREQDNTDVLGCLVGIGFDADKLASVAETLPSLCSILFEPFASRSPFAMKNWKASERADALLGENRWWFRSAGPPDLFLLIRAFHGVIAQVDALRIAVPWWQILTDAIGPAPLWMARSWRSPELRIERKATRFSDVSTKLHVSVHENGRQKVKLAMPAIQVLNLAEIMPPDAADGAREAGIDLDQISQQAAASGLIPQPLFSWQRDTRDYRVWLE